MGSIDSLDKQLVESKFNLSASEAKFDDISRKLATLEADAARGNARAEVGEEKTMKREEKLQAEIMDLRNKLKASDYMGEQAEMNIQRLNVRIDQTEEDLLAEKMKIKKISDELNQTFEDMLNMS